MNEVNALNENTTGDNKESDESEMHIDDPKNPADKEMLASNVSAVWSTAGKRRRITQKVQAPLIRTDWNFNEWKNIQEGSLNPQENGKLNCLLGRMCNKDIHAMDIRPLLPTTAERREDLFVYLEELIAALGSTQVQLKEDLKVVCDKVKDVLF